MNGFRDRADAGRQLAALLAPYRDERPIVLGLPRGGVVTAYEIAEALGAPLDVLVVRKIGAKGEPEFAVGAIASGGARVIDRESVRLAGMTDADVREAVRLEIAELLRRERLYRAGRPPLDLAGHTVILVDDGIATGATIRSAIAAARGLGASYVVVAAGVCPDRTANALELEADDVVCASRPDDLVAVGLFFDEFPQVSDDEVITLLARVAGERVPA